MISSPPPQRKKGRRLRLNKRSAHSSRKFATCQECSSRYITYSGSSLCVGCRDNDDEDSSEGMATGLLNDGGGGTTTKAAAAALRVDTSTTDTTKTSAAAARVDTSAYANMSDGGITDTRAMSPIGKENVANSLGAPVDERSVQEDTIEAYNICSKVKVDDEVSTVAMPTTGKEIIGCANAGASATRAHTSTTRIVASSPVLLQITSDHEKSSDVDDGNDDKTYVHALRAQEPLDGPDDDAIDDQDCSSAGGSIKNNNPYHSKPEDEQIRKGGDESIVYDDTSRPLSPISYATSNPTNEMEKERESMDAKADYRKDQHAASSLFFSTSNTSIGSGSSYRCFICNSDLSKIKSGLKGRMNHIKRCGKKHGIQAGDGVGELHLCHDEVESSTCANIDNDGTTSYNASLQYGWHDDADAELAVEETIEIRSDVQQNDNPIQSNAQQKQASLNSYFTRPVRSMDKVLLQGARNAAKKEKIVSKRQQSSSSSASSSSGKKGDGWKRKRDAPTTCPAYKRISNTSILVDAFHYANPALPQTHFLSHFHSDHYGGLTKHWSGGTIYCSLPTATLVHSQLGVEKKYLHPLPMNSPTVVDAHGKPVSVILLDANHCPGAVMFLFELPSGKMILHVGDFRWDRDIMLSQPSLQQFVRGSKGVRLDDIYLDTTYCDKKYESMPTQKQAIDAAVDVAVKEMKGAFTSLLPKTMVRNKSPTLLLFGSYTIGKEKIYVSCAQALGLQIYVEPRKFRILSSVFSSEQMNLFTTTKSEAQIWVVPMGHCTFRHMETYLTEANASTKGLTGGYDRVVAFRPTGWTLSATNGKKNSLVTTRRSGNKTIHGIPYSEHSSFAELVDCLLCLKPIRIVPTVSVSSSQDQIELLLRAAHTKEERDQYL